MKPVLCVLLVTLAFCCYEANAAVCSPLVSDLARFFWETPSNFRANLKKYNAPRRAVQAVVKLKGCVDQMPDDKRMKFIETLSNVVVACNQ
ncbi:secretoglobin family 1D member 2-like [Saccopteryx bilineata]|uniref:secretoglobin family 1D member 2-like n=1 Tax=Saccopteryx bilineata TaxID=59482 RepID=UPI00338F1084